MSEFVRESLPGGGWADLRDPAKIPERLRRPMRSLQMKLAKDPAFGAIVAAAADKGASAMEDFTPDQLVEMATEMGDEAIDRMDELNDWAILGRVAGWSFEKPVSLDNVRDLPGDDYDRLRELCAAGALQGVDFSPSTDAESPTGPSTASA